LMMVWRLPWAFFVQPAISSGHLSRIERRLAGSMVATIPIVILFFVLQKYSVQSVTSTGITG